MERNIVFWMVLSLFLFGCQESPRYLLYSPEIITTDASSEQVSEACRAVMKKLAAWVDNEDGGGSYPRTAERAKSWTYSEALAGKSNVYRGYFSCQDEDGVSYKIEKVGIPGEPILLLLESDDSESIQKLTDMLKKEMKERGIYGE
ncbi:MAG: hypothetical protein JW860_07215 [Sedimentisphaerales bacterium]|nr:hypothetical protein [Sedimentisphaerales bacterium]